MRDAAVGPLTTLPRALQRRDVLRDHAVEELRQTVMLASLAEDGDGRTLPTLALAVVVVRAQVIEGVLGAVLHAPGIGRRASGVELV